MAEVKVYNLEGKEMETVKLSDQVFDIPFNENLIKDVTVAYFANQRGVYAHTKSRGEVRGGGKKPWKQKGTGRARHGSIRSPLWIGGAVTFGPTKYRNFKVKINKKVKLKAFAMLLSAKLRENDLIVVDSLNIATPKTKAIAGSIDKLLTVLGKKTHRKIALVAKADDNLKLASRNIPNIVYVTSSDLGFLDVMSNEYVVLDKQVLSDLEKRLLK